jgi:hypothetical protein
MNTNSLNLADQQFPLPYNAYAAFDAVTLKQLMLQRLNENSTFTDQIYEGSNFSSFIDVIAYSYNVLLYYLNKTSNESLFATSQIYENMNKIVKTINYNPIGHQSCILKFEAVSNNNLRPGIYTIPKYSYFAINNIRYSLTQDATFVKSTTGSEFLETLSEETLLTQGIWREHPIITTTGEPFENFTIVAVDKDGNNVLIDHNSIDVYVRNDFGVWEQWTRVDSLFLHNGNDKVFECRLNENMRYNIRFGNNITGKQIKENSAVAIYYLESAGKVGEVGPNTINGQNMFVFNTQQYNSIMKDVRDRNIRIITFQELSNIGFNNNTGSSFYNAPETSQQIRENAPNLFKAQNRLVTSTDFQSYIKANFSNIVADTYVVNNWEYLDGHIKYLYNIGLVNPSQDSRVLYNQVKFADSCNFNDVYIYVVPRIFTNNSYTKDSAYLNPTAKQNILNNIEKIKMSTIEPVIMDPVYVAVGIGIQKNVNPLSDNIDNILSQTKLLVQRTQASYTSDLSLKNKVVEIIKNYFSPDRVKLGMLIDLDALVQSILSIEGVSSVFTSRKAGNEILTTESLSLAIFNPVYSGIDEDVMTTSQTIKLPYFKIPFLFNTSQIENSVEIVDVGYIDSGTVEY